MARLAMSTFGGKVVENSYVASQHYNAWLQKAEAQDRLGWDRSVRVDEDRHVVLSVAKDGRPLAGLAVTAALSHPLGRMEPTAMRFAPGADGALRSTEPLAAGRWRLDLTVRHGAEEARYRVDLQ
ncbi:MAG TPA: FixH family protein [Sphingopyxis sp.]|nr:FixH family protein [Sphingopyxis sp.]